MISPPAEPATPSTAQRIGWAVLILVTLYICYFSHLGVIGFVGPDEPRYAWIARDMAETGDWVTPRLYGKPWFEKPPLLYWGGAIFFKIFGDRAPETAARLPSAISALLATLALAWLAWRTYGEECARWLLLLLPTSVGMIGFSHAAATDMPFAGMLTIAMVCAAVVLGLTESENTPILPRTPWLALLLFGFFLGLAVLAKGPAGIILIGGAVFFWAIFTKRWRDAFRLLHPAAIAAFCLTALPWYFLCARRNPDFFRIFIIEHNFKRYLTPEFQHIQPFWFYAPVLLVGFLPWIALLVSSGSELSTIWHEPPSRTATLMLFISWFVFPLLFFTLSKSKLPGYILPALPPLSFLLSVSVIRQTRKTTGRWIGIVTGIVLMLIGRALPIAMALLDPANLYKLPSTIRLALLIAILGGVAVILLASFRRHVSSMLLAQIVFISIVFAALTGEAGETIDLRFSSRFALERYKEIGVASDSGEVEVQGPFTYQLPRGYQYSLNFYMRRELPVWSGELRKDMVVFISPRISRYSDQLRLGLDCPGENIFPGVIACRTDTSLDRSGGGRQPQQKE